MTLHARLLTPVVDGAPGEVATAQVELRNALDQPTHCTIRVVGLSEAPTAAPADVVAIDLQAGETTACLVPIAVPRSLGTGQHAAALQVLSSHPHDRPVLLSFTVAIASVERVELTPHPTTVRALRRAKIKLDVANHEPVPVELTLEGEAPDVSVRIRQPEMRLLPGEHGLTAVKLKGPRQWSGEPTPPWVVTPPPKLMLPRGLPSSGCQWLSSSLTTSKPNRRSWLFLIQEELIEKL